MESRAEQGHVGPGKEATSISTSFFPHEEEQVKEYTRSTTPEPVFNPLNPTHFGDAHERMSIARKNCPVSEFLPGLVFLARDVDVRNALKNTEVYSNVGNFELTSSNPPVITQMDPPRH